MKGRQPSPRIDAIDVVFKGCDEVLGNNVGVFGEKGYELGERVEIGLVE